MISAVSRAREYWLADQHVGLDLVADRKPVAQPFGLLAAQLREPAAGSVAHR